MDNQATSIYLIDGTALVYRSYFAFINNPLINSKGENTSAAYGVTIILLNLIRDRSPGYLSVAFDTGKPTFRHEMYTDYKATRQKMPDELIDQIPRVKEAVTALGIHQIEMDGYEADDVIGTLALQAAGKGLDVYMVTCDKDFMQLVGTHITIFNPSKNEAITAESVRERYGVPPDRIIDLFGLMGDSSDNVPGVPRVGEKTAIALLAQFGSLDETLARCDEISKPSIRSSIMENRDLALLSRKLVTIKTDVPLEIRMEQLLFSGINDDTARTFFREMEFNSFLKMLKDDKVLQPSAVTVVTPDNLDRFFEDLSYHREIAVDLETTSLDVMSAEIVGISIAAGGSVWYLPFGHTEGGNLDRTNVFPRLEGIFADPAIGKIGHNAKYDAIILKRSGFSLTPFTFDTMLAAYVLNPGIRGYALNKLADEHLNRRMQPITELIGSGRNQRSFAEVPVEKAAKYSGDDADVTLRLKSIFSERLDSEELIRLFSDVEMPLMEVLMDMEMKGVCLDSDFLGEMSKELAARIDEYTALIYEIAGEEFNINSTKQLGEILFDKLGLKPVRKSKTGYSTDIDILMKLAPKHELPQLVLNYRQLMKLKSTYVDALPVMVNPTTGRIHTSFNQAVTSTGRLSSSDPNLQNIPIRTDLGKNIRKAFIAPPGHVLLSADYSQIELRIMAHLSGDQVLRDAFLKGTDVHAQTASVLFGIPPTLVTPDQRRQAKTINFGVMYGMGAYSLSEQLGISRQKAQNFIDNYFETHPGVREFIDRTVREAGEKKFVTTLLGRKRYVPDISSTNHNVAEFAKRTAINTPLQGSAADLIKVSMIRLWRRLKDERFKAAMILQVHDELVLEIPEDELNHVSAVVRETMEGALKLDIPLVVDIVYGTNWLEAH